MKYDLRKPCSNCPFLKAGGVQLRKGRVVELCRATLGNPGAEFACHKTTIPDPDDESERTDGPETRHCAGAILMALKAGKANQMLRILMRLGTIDAKAMLADEEVVDSVAGSEDELLEAHGFGEVESCHVANGDCELPANYLDFEINPDDIDMHECQACGLPVCPSCSKSAGKGQKGRTCDECVEENARVAALARGRTRKPKKS